MKHTAKHLLDQQPPAAVEIEQKVIGCLMGGSSG